MLLVGSPMCTALSAWQRINNNIRNPVAIAAELNTAVMHREFCVSFYLEQLRSGRYFLHEHPAHEFVADRHHGEVHARARCHEGDLRAVRLWMRG